MPTDTWPEEQHETLSGFGFVYTTYAQAKRAGKAPVCLCVCVYICPYNNQMKRIDPFSLKVGDTAASIRRLSYFKIHTKNLV